MVSPQQGVGSMRRLSSQIHQIVSSKRTNLIFGANTDVGKTVVSAGLVQASLTQGVGGVHYIKPLQCGGSDQGFVEKHVRDLSSRLSLRTLFRWESPASPHIASVRENLPCSDQQVLSALQTALSESSHSNGSLITYIETAGGVLSPSAASPENGAHRHAMTRNAADNGSRWGWTLQGDLYQPLLGHAPVVLVGDGRLGGISCTLSALESLIIRGYDVAALVLLETADGFGNLHALREYVSSRGFKLRSGSGEVLFPTPSQSMLSLPPIPEDPEIPLHDWYQSEQVVETFARLDNHLQNVWEGQVSDLRSMLHAGSGSDNGVWLPSNSTDPTRATTFVDSAVGDNYLVVRTNESTGSVEKVSMLDASASWWTHGVGRGESSMALAVAAAVGRYGPVSSPSGVLHAPAVALAQALTGSSGPGARWASRVFFTDDGGSAAVEVAIKMGLKTHQRRMGLSSEQFDRIDWVVCAQEDCYHGDTLAALNVAEPYTDREHPWYHQKSLCLATPTLGYRDGKLTISIPEGMQPSDDVAYEFDSINHAMDISARSLTKLLSLYKEMIEMQWLVHEHRTHQKIGSVIIEPILQFAGGMKFIDPLWQRGMMEVAESRRIPVIFDESTAGLHRLGIQSCREILKLSPNIAIYSKLLTGGIVPLSVTLASEEVFDAFSTEDVQQSLLNGNTYIAGPAACVCALQSLSSYNAGIATKTFAHEVPQILFDEEKIKILSLLPMVEQSFALGTVMTVVLNRDNTDDKAAGRVVRALEIQGILADHIGDVIYVVTSPLTTSDECSRVAELLHQEIRQLS